MAKTRQEVNGVLHATDEDGRALEPFGNLAEMSVQRRSNPWIPKKRTAGFISIGKYAVTKRTTGLSIKTSRRGGWDAPPPLRRPEIWCQSRVSLSISSSRSSGTGWPSLNRNGSRTSWRLIGLLVLQTPLDAERKPTLRSINRCHSVFPARNHVENAVFLDSRHSKKGVTH